MTPAPAAEAGAAPNADVVARPDEDEVDWRDAALRLRAEMENYHKRQQRWAESEVLRGRSALLTKLLDVVDLVERAGEYRANPQDSELGLVHTALLSLLRSEGVEPVAALDAPFDPTLHEAVAMVPAAPGQAAELWVVAEERRGYRLGDALLRPARVVVARQA